VKLAVELGVDVNAVNTDGRGSRCRARWRQFRRRIPARRARKQAQARRLAAAAGSSPTQEAFLIVRVAKVDLA
jgi:hypothetical protein